MAMFNNNSKKMDTAKIRMIFSRYIGMSGVIWVIVRKLK